MPDVFIANEKKSAKDETMTEAVLPATEPKTETERMEVPGHTHKRLSSFCLYPEDINFETRGEKEKIILLLRQHVITNLKWILIAILMIFAPVVAESLNLFAVLPAGFDLVITLAWYLITTAYILESFLSWYFNVYFVTNERVIDVDFYNLIDKKVSDAELDKIQDVSYTNFGVLRLTFDYGDVFIQTAAEVSEFDFLAVPDPEKVTKIIDDLRDREKENS